MKECTFNRQDYIKNPKKWIEHYMQLHDEEVKSKKSTTLGRLFKKWIQ
jgi:translation elongation factor EF-Ts